jgi:hypothetical protein
MSLIAMALMNNGAYSNGAITVGNPLIISGFTLTSKISWRPTNLQYNPTPGTRITVTMQIKYILISSIGIVLGYIFLFM